jgi:hypothetical protein
MFRRLAGLALLLGTLAGAATAAPDALRPRLVGSVGRPAVGAPVSVTVRSRAARASLWVRGPTGTRSYRARHAGVGRLRARLVFPSLGRWTVGIRIGVRSWTLATVESRGTGSAVREPFGLAVAPDGALVVADRATGRILRVDPVSGRRTVLASGFDQPIALAYDSAGRLYVSHVAGIERVDGGGAHVRVAGNGTRGHTGDNGPATAAALGGHGGFAFLPDGRMVIAEYDGWVRVVRPDGTIGTLAGNGTEGYAGDGGPAAAAIVRHPHDVEALADGTILVADSHNGAVRAIGPNGVIRTVSSGLSAPIDLAAVPGGGFVIADAAGAVYRIAADGSRGTVLQAQRGLSAPTSVTVDGQGRIYAGDFQAGVVLRAGPGRSVVRVVG